LLGEDDLLIEDSQLRRVLVVKVYLKVDGAFSLAYYLICLEELLQAALYEIF
jgi:hypothetical protein